MTPKDKARELIGKFYVNIPLRDCDNRRAHKLALIAVEEMLGEYQSMSDMESILVINNKPTFVVHQLVYWMEVKQNIEKL